MAVCHRDGGVVSQTHRIATSFCMVNVHVVSTYIVFEYCSLKSFSEFAGDLYSIHIVFV